MVDVTVLREIQVQPRGKQYLTATRLPRQRLRATNSAVAPLTDSYLHHFKCTLTQNHN